MAEEGAVDTLAVGKEATKKRGHLERTEGRFSKAGGEERIGELEVELHGIRQGMEANAVPGSRAAKELGREVNKRERELAKLTGLQDDLITTRGSLEGMERELAQGNVQGAALADLRAQIQATEADLQQATSKIAGRMFTKAVGTGIGLGLDWGVTGGALGFLLAPRMVRGLRGLFAPGGKGAQALPGLTSRISRAGKAAKNAWESVADDPAIAAAGAQLRDQAGVAVDQAVGEAGRRAGTRLGNAFGGVMGKVAGKLPIDRAGVQVGIEAAGHAVGEGAAVAAAVGPDLALQGAAMGGVTGLVMGLAAHRVQHKLHRLGDLAVTKILPASRVAALEAFTDKDAEQAAEEIQHLNPDLLEAGILSSVPEGTPRLWFRG